MEMTTGMWVWMSIATFAWAALIGGAALALLRTREDRTASPLELLQRRLASGEIDREEYRQLRDELKVR